MAIKRAYGEEQPYIPAGIFKIRLPFIHYKWSWPEAFQALFMCATCLGAIPVLEQYLGIPYDLAWSMVIINGFFYSLHVLLGDPVVPGWITPAVPLVTGFIATYDMGPERTQSLIALQILVGLIFLIMGITGLAGKLIEIIPTSIKAGVLLGAGLAAVIGEMGVGGRFGVYPVAIVVGILIAYYCLFSPHYMGLREKYPIFNRLGKYGMLPAIIVALIVGVAVKELPVPEVTLGSIIKIPDFAGLWNTLSPFTIGFPALSLFIAALPTALVVYIIAFGDFVTSDSLIGEADEARPDEKLDFNANRSNLVSGIRNICMALIAPYTQLCGPLWAAVSAAVAQRYKEGREAMDSFYSGAGTFRWVTFLAVALVPIASLLQPVLPVALSLTLLVQGYICTRLAIDMCKTSVQMGIAGVMGAVLATRGAAWGLAVGIILQLLLHDWGKKQTAETEEKDAV